MFTIKEIKEKLEDRRISVVSEKTGLSRQVIYNIVLGKSKNPTYDTMVKLNEYFQEN